MDGCKDSWEEGQRLDVIVRVGEHSGGGGEGAQLFSTCMEVVTMQSRNIPQEENKQIAFFKKSFL